MELTEKLADFVLDTKYKDIPEDAIYKAKQCILDCLGVTLAGTVDPINEPIHKYIEEIGGNEQSTIVGLGVKTSAPNAAFINGVLGHVHDYDDFNYIFVGHSTVVLVPVILALGELLKLSGKEILTAFMVGTEVQWKIGDAMVNSGNHYKKGWHSTGTIGTLGAVAAAGKLLRLDSDRMAHAFGIAASEASGVREQLGSMTKAFHAGRAAENGVIAAMLAKVGFTSRKSAFEGKMGFFSLMSDEYDLNKVQGFGKPWGILETTSDKGLIFKLYPCCGSGDGSIDGIFSLIKEYDIKAEDVQSVECFGHEKKLENLKYHDPKIALEAKFSMEYWMTKALLERQVSLKQFTDEEVQDPRVKNLMKKVTFSHDPHMPRFPVKIVVIMKDGQKYKKTYWPPRGSPENPALDEELVMKYRSCADWGGLPKEKIEESIKILMNLEQLGDINKLVKQMIK